MYMVIIIILFVVFHRVGIGVPSGSPNFILYLIGVGFLAFLIKECFDGIRELIGIEPKLSKSEMLKKLIKDREKNITLKGNSNPDICQHPNLFPHPDLRKKGAVICLSCKKSFDSINDV